MEKKRSGRRRLLGTYTLPGGRELFGDLRLRRHKTNLRLHGNDRFDEVRGAINLRGTSVDGKCITLLDCSSPGIGSAAKADGEYLYNADVFPHFVVTGDAHLDPSAPCIASIAFRTPDLVSLFYDFDAFGTRPSPGADLMEAVLSRRNATRPSKPADMPWIGYFTGHLDVVEVPTAIGKVVVGHRPRFNSGGPRGVSIKGRMHAGLVFDEPVDFDTAYRRANDLLCFLSMAAGRRQATKRMAIVLATNGPEGHPPLLTAIASLAFRGSRLDGHKPNPGDVPLDPVERRSEFEAVVTHWAARHDDWRTARGRYVGFLGEGNKYGVDRLVGAANMFDILPNDAGLPQSDLDPSIVAARDACIKLFRQEAVSVDRNTALSNLGRIGKPSLPKKVDYRASLVEARLGKRFKELRFVCSIAVRVRNFYVHGSGDLDMEKVDPFVPLMTDALEFVFGASDFIEAGWDAARWSGGGWGHNFSRFSGEYAAALPHFKEALAN